MKTWLLFLLKLLLTAGCLAWAFSKVDFESTILSNPELLDSRWLAVGLVLAGATVMLTALRWKIFLAAQDIHVSFGQVLELTLIGNLFSLVSFSGLGSDAARILLLIRKVRGRKMAIAMSVLMDHLSGMVAMAMMFFLLTAGRFQALESQSVLGKGAVHFTWVYFVGSLIGLVAMFAFASPWVFDRVHRGGRWLPFEIMRTLPQAWDVYRRKWRHGLAGVGVSCAMLVVYYLTFWCGTRGVGCDVGAGTMLSMMPVVDAISTIPVSVSGIGVREKLFEVLLADLAGIPRAVAVSASLTGFLLTVCWSLVGGVLFLRHKGEVTVREIRETHV